MARNKPSVSARFDPDPSHYLLTEVEFERLCEVAKIPEKENLLFLLGLLVPCAINAYAAYPKTTDTLSVGFILNFIVVVLAGLLALFQGRAWYSKRRTYGNFVRDLKQKPEGRLLFSEPQQRMYVEGGNASPHHEG
jgi:hypothetical protein